MHHRIALCAVVAGLTLGAAAPAAAAPRIYRTNKGFGLGLMVGAPTGLAAKLFLDNGTMALAFGLGIDSNGHHHRYYDRGGYDDDPLHVHADVLWHPAVVAANRTLAVPFYVGIGARIVDHDAYYDDDGNTIVHEGGLHGGLRIPFGLALDFARVPLDVFLELVPVLDLISDHRDFALTGAIGARFYF